VKRNSQIDDTLPVTYDRVPPRPFAVGPTLQALGRHVGERLRDWRGFAAASTVAWSRASREVLATRRPIAALRAELLQIQLELGGAAYREDEPEMERLRARMRALENEGRELERGTHRTVEAAEQLIDEERLAIQPTEVVQLDGDQQLVGDQPGAE
jgi:hypothetical protein